MFAAQSFSPNMGPHNPNTVKCSNGTVSLDFLSVGHPEDASHNILVMVDHFTKFAWAVPPKDETVKTTAKVLSTKVIQQFGVPKRLLSDQGPNFETNLMKELCNLLWHLEESHTLPPCRKWSMQET